VVYVNAAAMAISAGKIPNTLDNLIAGGVIKPVIAVFIHAPQSFREFARASKDDYARMVATELVPFIDGRYRTVSEPGARLFMGGDEGGYAAIYAAFKHPGTFGMVAGQSTHLLPNAGGDELLDLVKKSEKIPVSFYLDWATYDYRSAQGGFDWRTFNRDFVKMLDELGYPVQSHEVHEGWGWASWRNRTDDILKAFAGR
jgi:enterochelin esterase family protein